MNNLRRLIFLTLLGSAIFFGSLQTALAFIPAPAPAPVAETPAVIPIYSNVPQSCYIVYETKVIAQARCPYGIPVMEAHDLWSGNFIGWSCDCELKNGPHRHRPDTEAAAF
jgi:hypothetical protein